MAKMTVGALVVMACEDEPIPPTAVRDTVPVLERSGAPPVVVMAPVAFSVALPLAVSVAPVKLMFCVVPAVVSVKASAFVFALNPPVLFTVILPFVVESPTVVAAVPPVVLSVYLLISRLPEA